MKHRTYLLSNGRKIFAGRNSLDNDLLVEASKNNETLLHTEMPGSPFVNVGENPTEAEIYEAGIFCAKYSQAWRDKRADIIVNVFKKENMNKSETMKEGTWNVKKSQKIKIKKGDILKLEEKIKNETSKETTVR